MKEKQAVKKSVHAQKAEILGLIRNAMFAETPEVADPAAEQLLHKQLDEICRIHGKERSEAKDLDLAISRLQVDRNLINSNRHAGKVVEGVGKALNFFGFNGHKVLQKGTEATEVGRAIALAHEFKKAAEAKAKLAELSKKTGLKTIVFADLDKETKEQAFGASFFDKEMTTKRRVAVIDLLKKKYAQDEREENKRSSHKGQVEKKEGDEAVNALKKRFGLE